MLHNWQYKRIGDVCIVERGGSPRPIDAFITDDPKGINWIKIGDTDDSMFITKTAQKIIPEGMKKSRYVEPGDFLLSNSMSFGRPYILKIDGCIHDGWLVLRDTKELFDKRFLYYYLSSKSTYQKFKMMAVGGVVNNLNSDMVRKVQVPIPSKKEQSEIADLLDKVSVVVEQRREELQKFDDLIKARFVEMFGDLKVNPKGWKLQTFDCLTDLITDGEHATPKRVEKGIYLLSARNILNHMLQLDDVDYIDQEEYDRIAKRVIPKEGDVLVSCSGTVGRCCSVPAGIKFQMVRSAALLRFKDCVNPVFVEYMITSDYLQEQINSSKTASSQANLFQGKIAKLKGFVPPIELQNDFLAFVRQVDKSKVAVQAALNEAQLLFDSLMQEYFG